MVAMPVRQASWILLMTELDDFEEDLVGFVLAVYGCLKHTNH